MRPFPRDTMTGRTHPLGYSAWRAGTQQADVCAVCRHVMCARILYYAGARRLVRAGTGLCGTCGRGTVIRRAGGFIIYSLGVLRGLEKRSVAKMCPRRDRQVNKKASQVNVLGHFCYTSQRFSGSLNFAIWLPPKNPEKCRIVAKKSCDMHAHPRA